MQHDRSGSAAPVALAAFCAGAMIAQQVAAKSLRDSLFLSNLSAAELPKVMLAAALLGLPAVLATSAGMARLGPGRLIPALLLASAALHGLEWSLLQRAPREVAVLVYLHVSLVGAITISGFWSIVNERFDPHRARQAIGIISTGTGTGGLAGGVIARQVGSHLGFRSLLVVLIGGALMAALGTFRLGASTSATPARSIGASGVRALAGSRYLRSLAALVACTGFAAALIDYAFKAAAPRSFHSGPELVQFFSAFYLATSVVTVVLQLTLSRESLDKIGLGGTLAALPFAILACGIVAILAPKLLTLTLLCGAVATLQNSLFRSSYELLYTPLPETKKRTVKTIIDVACDRSGEAVASGAILGLLALSPTLAPNLGIGAAVIAAGLTLRLSMWLQGGYVSELEASLRNGSVRLDESRVDDLTTRLALSQTQLEFDRAELLRQLALWPRPSETASSDLPSPSSVEAQVAIELWSGDVERIRAALKSRSLDPRHASLVIPLLDVDELAADAVGALCTISDRISGQLVDALLDPSLAQKLRRRIPRVLRTCSVPRAARGLAEALSDPDFEVRSRSALALHELTGRDERLRTSPRLVFEAARRELDRHEPGATEPPTSSSSPPHEPGTALARVESRRLEHVFTLLGLALDREALDLARRALQKKDEKLRGTALEYLENVVPERVRAVLFPYLEVDPRAVEDGPASRRPTPQILDDLKRSVG
jgi:hypothetical protein